jgi:hypothetical protein
MHTVQRSLTIPAARPNSVVYSWRNVGCEGKVAGHGGAVATCKYENDSESASICRQIRRRDARRVPADPDGLTGPVGIDGGPAGAYVDVEIMTGRLEAPDDRG